MESEHQNLIELTKTLLSFPSITPNDAGCQNLIKAHLEKLNFHCETLSIEGTDNLWARLGNQGPLVVFAGHTDVVPPGPLNDWLSPPFKPEIREGFLFGRGAVDMKGAIAAMMIAAQHFIQRSLQLLGSLAFLITSDEEGSAYHGTRKVVEMLEARNEKIDYCIIGEPSSEKVIGDQIRVGRRGSLHAQITVHGKQGHVAHPHLAKNPIHLSMQAFHELAHMGWDSGNDLFPATSFQITNIHSGTGVKNIIPGHLEVLCNFRFSTAITVNQLKERVKAIFEKYALSFDINWEVGGEPFCPKQGKLITATKMAIQEICHLSPRLSTGGGTSDGRFIAPTGAEIVELGLTHTTAHQVNECTSVENLITLTKCYERLLELLLTDKK